MSKHFNSSELMCKCGCGTRLACTELFLVLELVRLKFGVPVIITSGYRCPDHNKNVGGAPESKHVDGIAADIKVKGVEPKEVYEFLDETFPTCYGVGLYSSWVHIDVRSSKARW